MKKKTKIVLILTILLFFLFALAPWLDNQAIHDKVLMERGWKNGTIIALEYFPEYFKDLPDEVLQELLEESRKKGVENGILICDYKVMWFPFGRWVVSCEGGSFVTFWGQILP